MNLLVSSILISLFIVFYYLLIRVFTVLFRITGLTREKAHFQVISLLTNSGYTTTESELVTRDTSRRKIAKLVMISGMIFNVFIASLLINILISINVNDKLENLKIVGIAAACLVGFILIVKIPIINRGLDKLVEKIAYKIRRKNHNNNIIIELDAYGNKTICEIYAIKMPEELKDKPISATGLKSKYNIIILLVQRKGKALNARPDLMLQDGDRLIVFGKITNIKDLFETKPDEEKELNEKVNKNKLEVINNYGSNAVVEIEIFNLPKILENKTIAESALKSKYEINVLVIKREEHEKLVDASTTIDVGDKVILIGPYEHIKTLFLD